MKPKGIIGLNNLANEKAVKLKLSKSTDRIGIVKIPKMINFSTKNGLKKIRPMDWMKGSLNSLKGIKELLERSGASSQMSNRSPRQSADGRSLIESNLSRAQYGRCTCKC